MAFKTSRSRKCLYCVILLTFGITIFVLFSWTRILIPQAEEIGLETPWDGRVELKALKSTSSEILFDLNFKYRLSPERCNDGDNLLAVIIVTSHYNNVETRSAMRRSFSSDDFYGLGLRRVFLLGEAPDTVYMTQASVLHESKRFGDIIQGNFREAYRNLTYKHVMGLKWVSESCQAAKYVIKMDDDIIFNVKEMVRILNDTNLPKNAIGGYILRGMKPIREPANKWYVTQQEYRFSKYPSFVSGWFYVATPQIASKLVLASHYFRYFWIDDVYVTGVLAKNLKIKQYDLRKYFTEYSEFLQCCIADVKKRVHCDILVGPNGGDNNLFYEFNLVMRICQSEQCAKRIKPMNETCVAEKKTNLKGGSGIIEGYKLH